MNLLFINYFSNEFNPVGSQRTNKFVKYLSRDGIKCYLINASLKADHVLEENPCLQIHKVYDPSLKLSFSSAVVGAKKKPSGGFSFLMASLVRRIVVPDTKILWAVKALLSIRKLINSTNIDIIITSCPPNSMHLIGLFMKLSMPKIKWIADFRDGWCIPKNPAFGKVRTSLEHALENLCLKKSDTVVVTTRPMYDYYSAKKRDVCLIYNGFDEEDFDIGSINNNGRRNGKIIITHTGRFGGSEQGRKPELIFKALKMMQERYPELYDKVQINLVGDLTDEEHKLISSYNLNCINVIGHVSRTESLSYQAGSDILVLMTGSNNPYAVASKTYEYIHMGKPVLAIAKGNEAAKIINECNAGIVCDYDENEIMKSLMRLIADPAGFKPVLSPKYERKYQANQLRQAAEDLIKKDIIKKTNFIYTAAPCKEYITGGQRQIFSVLNYLEKGGHDMTYLEPLFLKKGLKLKFRLYRITMFLANFWYIRQLIGYRNRKAVVIQDYSQRFYLFLANWFIFKFKKDIRFIIFAQAFYFNCRNSRLKNLIDKAVSKIFLRHACAYITSGEAAKDVLTKMGIPEDKIGVVYAALREEFIKHKICPDRNLSSEDNVIKLLIIGRVNPIKGLIYLIEAVGILKESNVQLAVIGDYTSEPLYMETLMSRIQNLGLNENVKFLGAVYDDETLLEYYRSSDIFINPALWDTSPIALAEAMCAGMPLIASDVGGIPEWVEHGINGLLVPPKDSGALANAIKKLIDDPALRSEMGKKSFEKSFQFRNRTWDDVAKESSRIIFQTVNCQ